jgi:hypothetical protein
MIKNLNFCKDTRISYCIKQYKNTNKKKGQYKQFPEIRKKERKNQPSNALKVEIMKSQRKLSKTNTIKPSKTPTCARPQYPFSGAPDLSLISFLLTLTPWSLTSTFAATTNMRLLDFHFQKMFLNLTAVANSTRKTGGPVVKPDPKTSVLLTFTDAVLFAFFWWPW